MTSTPEISLIVARDLNGVIGVNGISNLPWHYEGDLKHFKDCTQGHGVIMGSKTWESLPKKPLPDRQNWILSRDFNYRQQLKKEYPEIHTAGSIDIIHTVSPPNGVWWVMGGAQIYEAILPYAHSIEMTIIPEEVEGDNLIYFPEISDDEWIARQHYRHPYNDKLKCTRYERSSYPDYFPAVRV